MKYEWIITGQEFFRQSSRQVGMLCGGMRNMESQNNVGHQNEQQSDAGTRGGSLEDRSEGEGKRNGRGVKWRRSRRSERRNEVGRFLITPQ